MHENPSANVMYNVSNSTLKVGQAVQYNPCALSSLQFLGLHTRTSNFLMFIL